MAKKDIATITVAGRLGKDCESRYTPAGKMVSSSSVAVNQWDGSTDWWDVVMWGEHWGNLVQWLTKGKQVVVSGRAVIRKWQDSEGRERMTPTIEVSEINLVGSRDTQQETGAFVEGDPNEVPF